MAFIHNLVGPDEKLIGIARLHWIYGAKGLLWLGGLILFGGLIDTLIVSYLSPALSPIGNAIFWVCALMGVVLFAIYYIAMLCTELGLTTKRCIYKRGLIMVDVREVDLEEVKSESVDNGVLGRILNYGYIKLDARFIEDIGLPAISDPYRFIKALNTTRTNIKEDSMRVVIDQHGGNVDSFARGIKHLQKQQPDEAVSHRDVPQAVLPDLTDVRYEAMSDDPVKNLQEIQENMHFEPKDHIPPKQRKKLFKVANQDENAEKNRKNRPFHHLFVHKKALHDKVINAFEEAEEKRRKA